MPKTHPALLPWFRGRATSKRAADVANNRKRKPKFTGAEKEMHNPANKQGLKRNIAHESIKKMEKLPDITQPLTPLSAPAVIQALNNMKYCVWSTSQESLEGEVLLHCEAEYVHDVENYVRSLHYALVEGTLVALDTDFTTKKKAAGDPVMRIAAAEVGAPLAFG
jgi:hypothetical protein